MKTQTEQNILFELSLSMLGVAGLDGYFKMVNPAFEKTLGYSSEEFMAKPFIDFVHPDDVEATVKAVEKLSSGAPILDFKNRYRCKNGAYKWLQWTATPVGDLLYVTAIDVTESKDVFFKIFQTSPIGIILINQVTGKYADANDRFLQMVGYERDELIGRTSEELNLTDTVARNKVLAKMREKGILKNEEIEFIKKSGETIIVSFSCERIMVDGELHFLNLLNDITEQKQAEEEIKRTTLLLADAQLIAQIGSWEWNVQTNTTFWSDEMYLLLGLVKEAGALTYESLSG